MEISIPIPASKADVLEQQKPQIPPRPVMPPDVAAYLKYKKIKDELNTQNGQIFHAERERGQLEIQRDDLRGIAKITKKSDLDRQIIAKEEEISLRKTGLSTTVKK